MSREEELRKKSVYLRRIIDDHTETVERLSKVMDEVSFTLGEVEQEWAELACPFREGSTLMYNHCHSPLIVTNIFARQDNGLSWAADTKIKHSIGNIMIDENMLPQINGGAYVKVSDETE